MRVELVYMQYNISDQTGSVLMFCSYYFKNGYPKHFVLIFCRAVSLALFLFFWGGQNQGFCSYKIVLIKNREKSMGVIYRLSPGVVLIFFSFVKKEILEKIRYVIFFTVFYWNDIFKSGYLLYKQNTSVTRLFHIIF